MPPGPPSSSGAAWVRVDGPTTEGCGIQNAIHAAPLEIGQASGVGVTINMALLTELGTRSVGSWVWDRTGGNGDNGEIDVPLPETGRRVFQSMRLPAGRSVYRFNVVRQTSTDICAT